MDKLRAVIERVLAGFENARAAIPAVFGEPRAHPREAMLLAVIVGLGLVFIVSAGMVLFDAIAGWVRDQRAGLHVRRRRGPVVILLPLSVLALLVLVVSQLPLSAKVSGTCDNCHEMGAAVRAWRSGAHASVGCWSCHASAGPLSRTAATLKELGRWVGYADSGTAAEVDSRACLGCHDKIARYIVRGSVRVQHSDMIEAGMECLECHAGVAHRWRQGASPFIAREAMTTCLLCHDGDRARAECSVCHDGRPSDLAKDPAPGVAVIRGDCLDTCHVGAKGEQCHECHGLEMPHPETFTRVHARTSAAGPALCARCHENASRTVSCACHPDGQIHGNVSVWYRQHGVRARSDGPGGCLCHDDTGFRMCLKCHDSSPW